MGKAAQTPKETKAPERRLEYMPLASLKSATRNPKRHDDASLGTSIGRFGYVEPMVLDERTGRLVAGHGRLEALRARKAAKEDAPQGVRMEDGEWLAPVLRGWASRSDTEAEAYLLASNQLTFAGGWDDAQLATLVKELEGLGAMDGLGFDEAQLARILAEVSNVTFKEYDEAIAADVAMTECPQCGHRFPK
jgi:ParB-like chromosome segregation protein Spo0J